jgi:hypothetical protein
VTWKAEGNCTAVSEIADQVKLTKPDIKQDRQYAAGLAAAIDIIDALGPVTSVLPVDVTLQGSGQAYPTAHVTVTIGGQGSESAPSSSWAAQTHGPVNHAVDIDKLQLEDPSTDPNVLQQFAAAKTAGVELVASGTIGNAEGWTCHMMGSYGPFGWNITVSVGRRFEEKPGS